MLYIEVGQRPGEQSRKIFKMEAGLMEAQVLKDARFTMVSQQLHYAAQPFPLITTGATNNQTQLVGGKYIFVCALQEEMWIFTSVYVHTEILFLVRTERGQI